MIRKVFFAASVAMLLASTASAATVTLTLDLLTPGQFKVLANVSAGDNGGIASYGLAMNGVASITSLDHNSPNTFASSSGGTVFGNAGFTLLRSADGVPTLFGSQDTTTPTPHLIYGYGQEASSFALKGMTPLGPAEGSPWGAQLLLAQGTYNAQLGRPGMAEGDFNTFTNVFTGTSGATVTPASMQFVTLIPEPATVCLLGLALVGGLGFIRRRAA